MLTRCSRGRFRRQKQSVSTLSGLLSVFLQALKGTPGVERSQVVLVSNHEIVVARESEGHPTCLLSNEDLGSRVWFCNQQSWWQWFSGICLSLPGVGHCNVVSQYFTSLRVVEAELSFWPVLSYSKVVFLSLINVDILSQVILFWGLYWTR